MSLLRKIIQESWSMLVFLLVMGIFNGLLNSGLLIFINNTINNKSLPWFPQYDWLVFTGLLVSTLLCNKIFQTRMIRLTNSVLLKFELDILHKLKHASFQDFERLGNENVYTAMEDSRILGHLPEIFMNAFNSLLIVLCCFGYLFWISPAGGCVVLGLVIVLLIFYLVRNKMIEKDLNRQRNMQNSFYKYLNDLLAGFRELKMSVLKNSNIYEKYLLPNRMESAKISFRNSVKYLDNELTGTYSWYLILGVIMFVLPKYLQMNSEKTTAFLITILYLIGHVAVLITLIPTYTAVKVSNSRLNAFNKRIGFMEINEVFQADRFELEEMESIRFENVTFEYKDEVLKRSFFLEPISLVIRKGELIFVVGGNGSGKSTFGYLLTGLYRPVSGKIYLNDKELAHEDFIHFSNRISAIFTNNYLFSENYGETDLRSTNAVFMQLLEMMKLDKVVEFNDKENKLHDKYSKGQQKRLALIYALLENKTLIVLDEWAAEQDPAFRKYFYQEFLPVLIKKGKTIVAITHDDEYYECASRIIKFNFGKITSDTHLTTHQLVG